MTLEQERTILKVEELLGECRILIDNNLYYIDRSASEDDFGRKKLNKIYSAICKALDEI